MKNSKIIKKWYAKQREAKKSRSMEKLNSTQKCSILYCLDSKFLFSFLSLLFIFLVFCQRVNYRPEVLFLSSRVNLQCEVSIKEHDMFMFFQKYLVVKEFNCSCSGFTIHTVHPKRACPWHYKALTIFRNRAASGKAVAAAAASSTNLLYRGEAAPTGTAAAAIFTRMDFRHHISSTLFIIWQ